MALVNCPECGKENVSNSARTCPECGFGVDEYFKKIQYDNAKEQKRIKAESDRISDEENRQRQEQERINDVQMPPKPSYVVSDLIFIVFMWIIGIVLAIVWANNPADDSGFSAMMLVVALPSCSIFPALFTWLTVSGKKDMREDYALAVSDFEAYKKKKVKSQDEDKERQLREAIQRRDETPKNKCPHCSSFDTKAITTLNRAISIGAVGLASSKIGKTMECKKCGYKW